MNLRTTILKSGIAGLTCALRTIRPRHWPIRLAAVATATALASCAGSTGWVPESTSSGGAPSAAVATDDCPAIDLRTPGGDRIDLNGTWETEREGSRAGIYYFRQIGTCVWFAGGFPKPTDTDLPGPLAFVTVVFRGKVSTDFSISGEWTDVRNQFLVTNPRQNGTLRLTIQIDGAGEVRLVYAGGEGQSFVEPGYREWQTWVKISDGGAYPPPSAVP